MSTLGVSENEHPWGIFIFPGKKTFGYLKKITVLCTPFLKSKRINFEPWHEFVKSPEKGPLKAIKFPTQILKPCGDSFLISRRKGSISLKKINGSP